MLSQRVERIEEDIREIRNDIRDLRTQGQSTLQAVQNLELALEQQFNRTTGNFDHAMHKIDLSLERMEGGHARLGARVDAIPNVWTFVSVVFIAVVGAVLAALALK